VSWGNGDGTYQAARSRETGHYPAASHWPMSNGDGKVDLVVTNVGVTRAAHCFSKKAWCRARGGVVGYGDGTSRSPSN